MTLVFDRTADLAGKPQTHVFLVGVSEYTHLPGIDEPPDAASFGLQRLASPALSAWEVCRWLAAHADTLYRPLGSIRLLMSPAPDEVAKLMPITAPRGVQMTNTQGERITAPDGTNISAANVEQADWAHFVTEAWAWRRAAAPHRDSVTMFYYSGHGLERSGDTLITLADFTDPAGGGKLQRCCEVKSNFVLGMAPTNDEFSNIARSQFYFIDACREPLLEPVAITANTASVWETMAGKDDRTTPIFLATYAGLRALAIRGQATDFCAGLLKALDTGSDNCDVQDAQGRWPVDSVSLSAALENYFGWMGTGQFAPTTGTVFGRPRLCWLADPPVVDFRVLVRPDAAIPATEILLTNQNTGFEKRIAASTADHPYPVNVPAGVYSLLPTASGAKRPPVFQLVNQLMLEWPVTIG
ncbi:hypothetical protein [Pararhizobium gei]|uniref:hypothetical protein n=1 Tax=Pararhizobium gei TaxID=1395951 RepID=UPI0023DA8075|nr:hypothetical protein [Rhizobium gei]